MYRIRFRYWTIAFVLATAWAIAGGMTLSAQAQNPDLSGNGRPIGRDSAGSHFTLIENILLAS